VIQWGCSKDCSLSQLCVCIQDNMDLDMAWQRWVALVTSNVPSLHAVCRLCGCLGEPPVWQTLTYLYFYSSLNCLFIHLWHRSYPHLSNSRLRPIYLVCGTAAPCDLFWLDIVKGVPNRSFVSLAGTGFFSVCLLCFGCMQCFVLLFLVVSTSAIDCLKHLSPKWPIRPVCRVGH